MTEQEYQREARLIAIEIVVANLYNHLLRASGANAGDILASEQSLLNMAAQNPVRGINAASSDLLSAEVEASLARLLLIAREARGA